MDHEDIDQDLLRGIAEFAQKQMGKGSAQTIQITNLVEERVRRPAPSLHFWDLDPPSAAPRKLDQQAR